MGSRDRAMGRAAEATHAFVQEGTRPIERRGAKRLRLDSVKDMKMPGAKNDAGKLMYSLIDDRADEALAAVLTFGASKYTKGGWRLVEDAIDRYFDAFRRHARGFRRYLVTSDPRHRIDSETGLPHSAQMLCNAHFLCALDLAANDPHFDGHQAANEALRRWRALEHAHGRGEPTGAFNGTVGHIDGGVVFINERRGKAKSGHFGGLASARARRSKKRVAR